MDAIEHYLIYSSFPEVGAILQIHAWIDGALTTQQSHPCGTHELAKQVVRILPIVVHPSRMAVGLKNHGTAIAEYCLDEEFGLIRGRLLMQVPMMA